MKIVHTMFLVIISVLIVSCSEAQQKREVAIDGQGGVLEKVSTDEFYDISRMEGIQIIDVRTTGEVAEGKIPGARNIDVMQWDLFVKEVESLDKSQPVLVYCKVGGRSAKASAYLKGNGFKEIYDLRGGYDAWSQENHN